MKSPLPAALLALTIDCCGGALAQDSSIAGLWQTVGERSGQPDGLVRITESGGEFTGRVTTVFSPPVESANPLCVDCRGELKGKPVVGMAILRARRAEDGTLSGTILDPYDGNVYSCDVELLENGRKLKVHGYIGVRLFGRSLYWTRRD